MKTFPYNPAKPSAAQELPMKSAVHSWPDLLHTDAPLPPTQALDGDNGGPVSGTAEPVPSVWELVGQTAVRDPRKTRMRYPIVPYELCFQGI
jgi:hypothetical protein